MPEAPLLSPRRWRGQKGFKLDDAAFGRSLRWPASSTRAWPVQSRAARPARGPPRRKTRADGLRRRRPKPWRQRRETGRGPGPAPVALRSGPAGASPLRTASRAPTRSRVKPQGAACGRCAAPCHCTPSAARSQSWMRAPSRRRRRARRSTSSTIGNQSRPTLVVLSAEESSAALSFRKHCPRGGFSAPRSVGRLQIFSARPPCWSPSRL